MAILKTRGFIISNSDFRRTSRLVTVFTRDYGKIRGILKGVRKSPLKYPSGTLLFSLNEIVFYQSRNSDLHLISFIDCLKSYELFYDMDAFYYACFFCKAVDRILPLEEKNEDVFGLLDWVFQNINTGDKEKLSFIFLIKFFEYTGFKPHLFECVSCAETVIGNRDVFFDVRRGGFVCQKCRKDSALDSLSAGTASSLQYLQKQSLDKCLNLKLSAQMREDIRKVLHYFLVYHMDVDTSLLMV